MQNNNTSVNRKEKIRILREKNFTSGEAGVQNFLVWLVMAEEVVKENLQLIADDEKVSDIEEAQKVNDFIYQELNSLQSGKSGDDREQNIAEELQSIVGAKKSDIDKIKELIEAPRSSDRSESSVKKVNSVLKSVKAWKNLREKRKSQIINNSQVMKGNQTSIKSVKTLLNDAKKELNNNPEAEELLQRIEGILGQDEEDNLKVECEKLRQALDDGEYKEISNSSSALNKILLKYYLDNWYAKDNELSPEEEEKLKKFDEIEKERDELKQKVEELEEQGGVGVDEKDKKDLEKLIEDVLTACNINDDELANDLALEDETWRNWLGECDTPYHLAYRYGKITGSIKQISAEKEKDKLEQEAGKGSRRTSISSLVPRTPRTPRTPMSPFTLPPQEEEEDEGEREEKSFQEWLEKWVEDECEGDNEGVYEIGKPVENIKLVGEAVIKDYPNLESISLKNMGITKLTVEGCPNTEEIEVHRNEITEIVGLENLPKLQMLSCGKNQIKELNISKNTQLSTLITFDNPDIEIYGFQNLSNLVEFNGSGSSSINLLQIIRKELQDAAKGLGIDENELENETSEELMKLIEEEGNKIKRNKSKLDKPTTGLPGLLSQENEVNDNKLAEINKKMAEVEKLEKKIKEVKKEIERAKEETKKEKQKTQVYKDGLEKAKGDLDKAKTIQQLIEEELGGRVQSSVMERAKKKAEDKAERQMKKKEEQNKKAQQEAATEQENMKANIEVGGNK